MSRAVHQLIASASPFDAVTFQAIAWRDVVRDMGLDSEVFAADVDPRMRGVSRIRGLHRFGTREAAMLHYSIGSRVVDYALSLPPGRLGIYYHNITPGRMLASFSPVLARLCDEGRERLAGLATRVGVAAAVSAFNAHELEALGFADVTVVPLIVPVATDACPDRAVGKRVLTVGRVAPNKRIEDAIRAIAFLRAALVPDARLTVIGGWSGFERYRVALDRLIRALGLHDVVSFLGQVPDAVRDQAYDESAVYLCMSEHEGFCVPLVEAMARGVPVVARAAGAVPETVGRGALLLPDEDPAVAAEALAAVMGDPEIRQALKAGAKARLKDFATDTVRARVRSALAPLAGW